MVKTLSVDDSDKFQLKPKYRYHLCVTDTVLPAYELIVPQYKTITMLKDRKDVNLTLGCTISPYASQYFMEFVRTSFEPKDQIIQRENLVIKKVDSNDCVEAILELKQCYLTDIETYGLPEQERLICGLRYETGIATIGSIGDFAMFLGVLDMPEPVCSPMRHRYCPACGKAY